MTCPAFGSPRLPRHTYCPACSAARLRARNTAKARKRRSDPAKRQAKRLRERSRDKQRDPQRKRTSVYRASNAERSRRRRARTHDTDITKVDLTRLYSAKRCPLCDTDFDPKPTDPHGQHLDHHPAASLTV